MIKSHRVGDVQIWTCTEDREFEDLSKKGEIVYTLRECELGDQMSPEIKHALLRMKSTLPSVRVLNVREVR